MPSLNPSIELLQSLVGFPSVSSRSNREISDAVGKRLEDLGFQVEQSTYQDDRGVQKVNLVGRRDPVSARSGGSSGGLAYFCHTDVVPAKGWTGPGGDPFSAVVQDDRLYGRGSCDMKGSLVAMLEAATRVTAQDQSAPLWIVCTADEEIGFQGARHLVDHSAAYRQIVQSQPVAVIGEPTGLEVVHGHKGITGVQVISRGRAAHSSTTDGINANEAMVPMLQTLLELKHQTESDTRYRDDRFDPPTLSWTFGVSDGCQAINITPARSVAWVSIRPMPEIDGWVWNSVISRVDRRCGSIPRLMGSASSAS
jgi:acetylornithine deacetylase